ncbi:MAG: Lrp/AsnC family transcriptional regulator [Deltaproteobacteria bacterium]|nr:Lrp/AsnC family transcriptional regulator [Deltaproteobacteria bacterium]
MRKKTGKRLDKIDSKIIGLLQKNGRLPTTQIAKELGISETTVRKRLDRLIEEEFIQVVAVGNPFKLGFGIVGTIKISIDIKEVENVIRELQKLHEVWYIAVTTGATDIDIEFNTRSLEDLHDLVYEKINKIDGIIRTETMLIIRYAKRRYDWGTALDYPRSSLSNMEEKQGEIQIP